MSVLDIVRDRDSKQTYETDRNEAFEQFEKQVNAVSKISQTEWFQVIKEYRAREVVTCQKRLQTMKREDFRAVQAELNLATRFLDYIDMIQNPPV